MLSKKTETESSIKVDEATPKRDRSSPDSPKRPIKRSTMTTVAGGSTSKEISVNLESLSSLLDKKLALLATKEDIQQLHNEYGLLKEENKQLKRDVEMLKEANSRNEKFLEELDNKARRNNLIFRGVAKIFKDTNEYSKNISKFCEEILQVAVSAENLHVLALNKTNDPQLLAMFTRTQNKQAVLIASSKLKNTGFVIHQDLSKSSRVRETKLLLLRKELYRLNKNLKLQLRSDRLFVGGVQFTWCNLLGLCHDSKPGVSKLQEITGFDLKNFTSALFSNTLPFDYFKLRPPSTSDHVDTALNP